MESAALTVALALLVGVLAQSAARHIRVPGIVLLLLAGTGLGPDGLGWVRPRELGHDLFTIVDFAVAVILFEGGLNLQISRLRREQASIRRLVSIGALVTLLGGTLAAWAILDWSWIVALLFGSMVVVTGPTVVTPLVRELRLGPRVSTVLEAEGVLIDPIGAILAVLVLELALAPDPDSLLASGQILLFRLTFGAVAGVAVGFALASVLRVRRVVPEGHENILALASVLLLYAACERVVSHSGILAVTVAGVVVGNIPTHVDRDLREFKDQLTVLLIGLLFVLLAADVRLVAMRDLGWRGAGVVAVLVVFVRPFNVAICTIGSNLSLRERSFIAWVAPRGIVAAAVASIMAAGLEGAGMQGGSELRALVFLTIAGTVTLAGATALPVASLLGLRLPRRDTVAILGAQGLGLLLGRELRRCQVPVTFLDANPGNCRQAEEDGFPVIFGDALQERTLQRGRFEAVGVAIGITPNQLLNTSFVKRARDDFRVPEGYVAVLRPEAGLAPELVQRGEAFVLFDGPHDVERWDVRCRHSAVAIERFVYGGAPDAAASPADGAADAAPGRPGDRFVVLTIERGGRALPMFEKMKLQAADVAAVAIHEPDRTEALAALGALGFTPAEAEAEAEAPPT